MAKQTVDTAQEYKSLESKILQGDIEPVYLLFGTEHYYIDKICDLLMKAVIRPGEEAFGQLVFYGSDSSTNKIISAARQFPMMVSRQLVVVKEAQMISRERGKIEDFDVYLNAIMPSTVLVICYKTSNDPTKPGKNIDKRTSFYKHAQSAGVVFESMQVADYKMPAAIEAFVSEKGLSIDPSAARLFAEYAGVDLQKIDSELTKLMKVLPEGSNRITVEDIEKNVGISRDYSEFELTRALAQKDAVKCFRIAHFFADSPKRYPIQKTLAVLSSYFIKILRMDAMASAGEPRSAILSALGINPYFSGEYDAAARNYPLKKAMRAVALIKDCDYKSKSNLRGEASDGDLLMELVSKLLAC